MKVKYICEIIAWYFEEAFFIFKTGEEVFNYSPTGELSLLWFWYEDAKRYLGLNFQ